MATGTQTGAAQMATRKQTVVVEYHEGEGWWLMLDDGTVAVFDTSDAALKSIKRAAKKDNAGVTLTAVEWRNVPEGFQPS
jgi:hypothetical protein